MTQGLQQNFTSIEIDHLLAKTKRRADSVTHSAGERGFLDVSMSRYLRRSNGIDAFDASRGPVLAAVPRLAAELRAAFHIDVERAASVKIKWQIKCS